MDRAREPRNVGVREVTNSPLLTAYRFGFVRVVRLAVKFFILSFSLYNKGCAYDAEIIYRTAAVISDGKI
jgi:hypothetical protein